MQSPGNLSSNLRYLRIAHGLSQGRLAEKLGLTRSKIASYENDKAQPNARSLLNLTEFFRISLRAFIIQDLSHEKFVVPSLGHQPLPDSIGPGKAYGSLYAESHRLHAVAQGYRAMYELKSSARDMQDGSTGLLTDRDIETMLDFIDLILACNDRCLRILESQKDVSAPVDPDPTTTE